MLAGANQSFQFKCPVGLRLCPVEPNPQSSVGRAAAAKELSEVYQYTSTKSDPGTCGPMVAEIGTLVPRSRLEVAQAAELPSVRAVRDSSPVFKLILGPAQATDMHFCYTCTASCRVPPTNDPSPGVRTPDCTIHVTVPKEKQEEQGADQKPGLKPEGQQPNPQPEQPPDSGVSAPSVSRWLIAGAAGSAFGLAVYR